MSKDECDIEKRSRTRVCDIAVCAVLAFFSTLALTLSVASHEFASVTDGALVGIAVEFSHSFDTVLVTSLVYIALFLLFMRSGRWGRPRKRWLFVLVSLAFAGFMTASRVLDARPVFSLPVFCKIAIMFFGLAVLGYVLMKGLLHLLETRPWGIIGSSYGECRDDKDGQTAAAPKSTKHGTREQAQPSLGGRLYGFIFEAHPFIMPAVLIFLSWLPYLILCFPGSTDPNDTLDQLQQMHGIFPHMTGSYAIYTDGGSFLNGHHPVFHTVLLNLFIDAGALAGSQNIGLFAFVLLQTACFIVGFAASLCLMKRMNTPKALRVAILAIYCLCPLFPGWAINVTKDTLFTALMVLYVVFLVYAVAEREYLRSHKGMLLAWFLVALALMLTRNNGILSVVLSAPFLLLLKGKGAKTLSLAPLAALVVFVLVNNMLFPALGIAKGSAREALSIPFQQTALYVRMSQDVTQEEANAIKQVLACDSLDEIAERYDYALSDPVKNLYNIYATPEDLATYLTAWAHMGLRHPEYYAMATVLNFHSYFYPETEKGWVWLDFGHYGEWSMSPDMIDLYHEDGFMIAQYEGFEGARDVLTAYFYIWEGLPLLGLVSNMGACSWLLIALAVIFIDRRKYRYLIPMLPVLGVILVCVASPSDGNIRYALPYIAATPLLACLAVHAFDPPSSKEALARGTEKETLPVRPSLPE